MPVPPRPDDWAELSRLTAAAAGSKWADAEDRAAIEAVEKAYPGVTEQLAAARSFHARAAGLAVREGARGAVFAAPRLPADPDPHAQAMDEDEDARFVYAVNLPEHRVVTEAELAGPRVAVVSASALHPEYLMSRPEVRAIGTPLHVQVQLLAHFWAEEEARSVVAGYARLLTSGSTLLLSVAVPAPRVSLEEWREAAAVMTGIPLHAHTAAGVTAWLEDAGLQMMPPWAADVRTWLPMRTMRSIATAPPGRIIGAVARKP